MDVHAAGTYPVPGVSRLTLRIGEARYPIIDQDGQSCLVLAPEGIRLRGFADIYEGEIHRDRALILLSEPEGEFVRLTWKRRSPVLPGPPGDFAP